MKLKANGIMLSMPNIPWNWKVVEKFREGKVWIKVAVILIFRGTLYGLDKMEKIEVTHTVKYARYYK